EAVLLDSLGREAVASAQAGVSSGILSVALMSEVTGGESSLKAAKGPRQVGVVRYGSAQGFPSNPLFLGGIAAVVIEDFDASTLSQAQLSAIAEYVGLGGNLVLAGGSAWRRTLSQLPTALLPLHPSATGRAWPGRRCTGWPRPAPRPTPRSAARRGRPGSVRCRPRPARPAEPQAVR